MTTPHRYKLLYTFEPKPEGIVKEELEALDDPTLGACDAILVASIVYPEDGSFSVQFLGLDGRDDTDLSDFEMFKIWTLLAARLADSKTLDDGRRRFAQMTFEGFLDVVGITRPS